MSESFMKKPCPHCPYRRDVRPFLTMERAEELAYAPNNPYNSFACHQTTVSDEEFGGDGFEMLAVETSRECAGFLTMQINENANEIEGFEPAWREVYSDAWEMLGAYEDAQNGEWASPTLQPA